MERLNQVLAVEKEVKGRVHGEVTRVHALSKKRDLFDGFAKSYQPKDEDGETFPDDKKPVQITAEKSLEHFADAMSELFDVTAQKDFANCSARADVCVNGTTILENVPATFLLFLEKQLTERVTTFIKELPSLDPSKVWTFDTDSGHYRSEVQKTHKTRKVQKPIVLFPATKEHAAQTQLITEDEVVGYWDTTHLSGALGATPRAEMLERATALLKAVKQAREQANIVDAEKQDIGRKVFDYITKETS
jgi:hypothetical protein